ncbi:hypothetical protein RugamoR57_49310 [Duganella caerulea]
MAITTCPATQVILPVFFMVTVIDRVGVVMASVIVCELNAAFGARAATWMDSALEQAPNGTPPCVMHHWNV